VCLSKSLPDVASEGENYQHRSYGGDAGGGVGERLFKYPDETVAGWVVERGVDVCEGEEHGD